MILGIDASTPGSGGGKRHLIEIIKRFKQNPYFDKVKIWGVSNLLDQLPDGEEIIKISPPLLNRGWIGRLIWQVFLRHKYIKGHCDILLSPFGTFSSSVIPYVSMSRNMLVFDKIEQARFGLSMRLKFFILKIAQTNSFRNSAGVIFLSKYARETIGKQIDFSKINSRIIHHGISTDFTAAVKEQKAIGEYSIQMPYQFLYVSSVWPYKHTWTVVEAVNRLRQCGYPVVLKLVGEADHKSSSILLRDTIKRVDPAGDFIFWYQSVSLSEVADYYKQTDSFIFASSCENMPNILVEAMAAGVPIVCSKFPPMPEFLKDAGLYFSPLDLNDLTEKLKGFLDNKNLRWELATKSASYSRGYDWDKCAAETYRFLYDNTKFNNNV